MLSWCRSLLMARARAQAQDEPPAAQELQGRPHLGHQRRVAERLAHHGMAERQPRVPGGHVAQRGERFQHVRVAELEVVDEPGPMEVARHQAQGAVQVRHVGAALRLFQLIRRHDEPELDARHGRPSIGQFARRPGPGGSLMGPVSGSSGSSAL
jgi:hypothetical protein